VAIAAASSPFIACTDAGCTYPPEWLARISASLVAGSAEYALEAPAWTSPIQPSGTWLGALPGRQALRIHASKSCTARSMAFTKDLWQRIGGFPESVFFGEDTLFDLEARRLAPPAFVEHAKALYRSQLTFRSACRQLGSYAISDGILGVRPARLYRNAARCIVQLLALLILPGRFFRSWPSSRSRSGMLHPDWRLLWRYGLRAILARFLFSVLVPWIIAIYRIRGTLTKSSLPNRQNL